ncbi:MAG: DUF6786 family protein [Bacteroidales bacterium]
MEEKNNKGTFGYDLEFLKKYHEDLVVLKDSSGNCQLIICPAYQGRVMTSTSRGEKGMSYGWINYELIESRKKLEKINPFGGEDRFWLGPEGGQFSVFFKKGSKFDFSDWNTPAVFDTEPFTTLSSNDTEAVFEKSAELENYAGTIFKFTANRIIRLINEEHAEKILGLDIKDNIDWIGFESENTLTNSGDNEWNKETGMPSIWILGMFAPSPSTTIVIPYVSGDTIISDKIVEDSYFGKIGKDRLVISEDVVFFKGDGQKRGKIGIPPTRAKSILGSYDSKNKVLTVVNYNLHPYRTDYVNSLWKFQDNPFGGDAVNAYNDGPLEDGSQMGPFYELETSSPAAGLSPGSMISHVHRTFHFTGEETDLDEMAKELFGISLDKITSVFN